MHAMARDNTGESRTNTDLQLPLCERLRPGPWQTRVFASLVVVAAVVNVGCRSKAGADVERPAPAAMTQSAVEVELAEADVDMFSISLDEDLTPPQRLSPTEFREDVLALRRVLDEAWGGKPVVPEHVVADAYARLASMSPVSTPAGLCTALGQVLDELPDAHFSVAFEGRQRCVPSSRRAPAVGANFAASEARPWAVERRDAGERTVALVSIKRFLGPGSPQWGDFLAQFEGALDADAVILDLRGNGGGNDTYAYWVAQRLAGRPIRREGVRIERLQTPLALRLVMNLLVIRARADLRRTGEVPTHFDAPLQDLAELSRQVGVGVEPPLLSFAPGPASDLELTGTHFEGPVFLLADAGCGSSCENAVFLLRQLANVTVVGEPTAGAIHFGQSGRLVLPNSKVVVTVATQAVRYDGDGWWEKVGFPPDVQVPAGEDALSVALAQLEVASQSEKPRAQ